MHQVKMHAEVVDVARRDADRWYVSNGAAAVGPVRLDLLARGVEAGKVPIESFVRHEGWKVWRPLTELAEIVADEVSHDGGRTSTDDILALGRPSTPGDFLPADAIDGATDRREAFLLLLPASVSRVAADGAIVHEVDDVGATVVCAHGPASHDVLGARTKLLDPAVLAAAAGAIVIAEPTPGPAGQSIVGRFERLGLSVLGAAMVPIRPHGRLVGILEVGRGEPFRAAEVASLDELVQALVAKLEVLSPASSRREFRPIA
jgi:hypothetical protein